MARHTHATKCRHCERPMTVSTVQAAPPNLAALVAAAECKGDGCDPDPEELPDDEDVFPMGEPDVEY